MKEKVIDITDIVGKEMLDLIGELGKLSDDELEALATGIVGIA